MEDLEKYIKIFMDSFEVGREQVETLEYQGISRWDSVGHMALISEIEDIFGIMMEADDIIDFSSYEKGKEILRKYEISI